MSHARPAPDFPMILRLGLGLRFLPLFLPSIVPRRSRFHHARAIPL